MGIETKGKKAELIERLESNAKSSSKKPKKRKAKTIEEEEESEQREEDGNEDDDEDAPEEVSFTILAGGHAHSKLRVGFHVRGEGHRCR